MIQNVINCKVIFSESGVSAAPLVASDGGRQGENRATVVKFSIEGLNVKNAELTHRVDVVDALGIQHPSEIVSLGVGDYSSIEISHEIERAVTAFGGLVEINAVITAGGKTLKTPTLKILFRELKTDDSEILEEANSAFAQLMKLSSAADDYATSARESAEKAEEAKNTAQDFMNAAGRNAEASAEEAGKAEASAKAAAESQEKVYEAEDRITIAKKMIQGEAEKIKDLPLEKGEGDNSVQQTLDNGSYSWIVNNPSVTELLVEAGLITINEDGKISIIGALGNFSSVFGGKGLAIGKRSSARGTSSIAYGKNGIAEGDQALAYGETSHAIGCRTAAIGPSSSASGTGSIGKGEGSDAGGYETEADGGFAFSRGHKTKAKGLFSSAFGSETEANESCQFVAGKHNLNKPDTLFEVGNGADQQNKSNAIEVYLDGHAEVQTQGETRLSVTTRDYVDSLSSLLPITVYDGSLAFSKGANMTGAFPALSGYVSGKTFKVVKGQKYKLTFTFSGTYEQSYGGGFCNDEKGFTDVLNSTTAKVDGNTAIVEGVAKISGEFSACLHHSFSGDFIVTGLKIETETSIKLAFDDVYYNLGKAIEVESGTWSPKFEEAAGVDLTAIGGSYNKIGNQVTLIGGMDFTKYDSNDFTQILIKGLPLVPKLSNREFLTSVVETWKDADGNTRVYVNRLVAEYSSAGGIRFRLSSELSTDATNSYFSSNHFSGMKYLDLRFRITFEV